MSIQVKLLVFVCSRHPEGGVYSYISEDQVRAAGPRFNLNCPQCGQPMQYAGIKTINV